MITEYLNKSLEVEQIVEQQQQQWKKEVTKSGQIRTNNKPLKNPSFTFIADNSIRLCRPSEGPENQRNRSYIPRES